MHPLIRLLLPVLLLSLFTKIPLLAGPTTAAAMIGDTIVLQALANNKYVCADNAGASALIANRTVYSTWEEYNVIVVSTGGTWGITWRDEFTGVGNYPYSGNWGYDLGAGGWGNNELETYVNSFANAHII